MWISIGITQFPVHWYPSNICQNNCSVPLVNIKSNSITKNGQSCAKQLNEHSCANWQLCSWTAFFLAGGQIWKALGPKTNFYPEKKPSTWSKNLLWSFVGPRRHFAQFAQLLCNKDQFLDFGTLGGRRGWGQKILPLKGILRDISL